MATTGTGTGTATKARARSAPAAGSGEARPARPRWLTMPPIEGFSIDHDAANRYRLTPTGGQPRIFTGGQMARVVEELRSPGKVAATAPAKKAGPRPSGSGSRNAGK